MISAWWLVLIIPTSFLTGFCVSSLLGRSREHTLHDHYEYILKKYEQELQERNEKAK